MMLDDLNWMKKVMGSVESGLVETSQVAQGTLKKVLQLEGKE